jgi:hypothetical protein
MFSPREVGLAVSPRHATTSGLPGRSAAHELVCTLCGFPNRCSLAPGHCPPARAATRSCSSRGGFGRAGRPPSRRACGSHPTSARRTIPSWRLFRPDWCSTAKSSILNTSNATNVIGMDASRFSTRAHTSGQLRRREGGTRTTRTRSADRAGNEEQDGIEARTLTTAARRLDQSRLSGVFITGGDGASFGARCLLHPSRLLSWSHQ